ncbi:hypothetical protein LTR66_004164 [Elasticomyces elasticus]|nr:hypothetical protein LTR66_004164 [Elasticomyces elasticus]
MAGSASPLQETWTSAGGIMQIPEHRRDASRPLQATAAVPATRIATDRATAYTVGGIAVPAMLRSLPVQTPAQPTFLEPSGTPSTETQWASTRHRYPCEDEQHSRMNSPQSPTDLPMTGNVPFKFYSQRRLSNRDEFDGPHQLLDKPAGLPHDIQDADLPYLPTSLHAREQDNITAYLNDRLSQCAFDFVARYQFPIPIEPDKRPVRAPTDRDWTEWVHLLKRLATKRRIPARVLWKGQIKPLVAVLENSLEIRLAGGRQGGGLVRDDRNVLQLVSAGLQVAKFLKDAEAMRCLDALYVQTEALICARRATGAF